MIDELVKNLAGYHGKPLPGLHGDREKAAVLIPVVASEDPAVLLTERSSRLDTHAGEIAWPGGKQDRDDESLQTTALRESEEEIGLRPQDVRILAELRPFISKYGLLVTPFVGILPADVGIEPNPAEIESVFRVPLSWLRRDPRTQTDVVVRHGETHHVPVYHYEGYRIWGLTAMILWEFLRAALGVRTDPGGYAKLSRQINEGWLADDI